MPVPSGPRWPRAEALCCKRCRVARGSRMPVIPHMNMSRTWSTAASRSTEAPCESPSGLCSGRLDLDDELDRHVRRQGAGPEGRSRVAPGFPEEPLEQVRCAIDGDGLLVVTFDEVHEAEHLDYSLRQSWVGHLTPVPWRRPPSRRNP